MHRFTHLLGFCSATDKNRKLSAYGDGLALYPWQRAAGYAYALRSGIVGKVILFGPDTECSAYAEEMAKHGVSTSELEFLETHETTIGNGRVMQEYLEKLVGEHTVCSSTSAYHASRAELIGRLNFELTVPCIPAEAFIFAAQDKMNVDEAAKLLWSFCPKSLVPSNGVHDLVYDRRTVAELQGTGALLAGNYHTDKHV